MMRFVGIDIGAERHMVAVLDEQGDAFVVLPQPRLRAAGKPGKVAIIAAMRELLAAVWSVATHRKPFVPHLARVPAPLGVLANKA